MKKAPVLYRRQKEIREYLREYIKTNGSAPSLKDIADRFGLSSLATVHKHLKALESKGVIRRTNRARSIELIEEEEETNAISLPLKGLIAAGKPIENFDEPQEDFAIPMNLTSGKNRSKLYVLKVQGDSMIDELISDGDYVIIEETKHVSNGETVVARLQDGGVTLKKYYREKDHIRLQPANKEMPPFILHEDIDIQGKVVAVCRKY
jgi:repressor LexA